MNLVCLFFYLFTYLFFLHFTQKFKMAAKSGGKTNFVKIFSRPCRYPVGQKLRRNRSISLHFQDKRIFVFNTEIQDGCQKWLENDFWEKSSIDSANTLRVKNFIEIALSRSVSEINVFLHFMQKVKMAAKSGGKINFEESC